MSAPRPHPPGPITVIQGDHVISRDPQTVLTTVLGSCIAVCLYDPEAGIGGMNHFLLPGRTGGAPEPGSGDLRYGAYAMELLINALLKQGAERRALCAKVFGGASMIGTRRHIGSGNAAFARRFLQDEGIPCTAESTGGTAARRVQFWPTSGRARQMLVPAGFAPAEPAPPAPKPVAAAITLF
jgi:chemotaxis protein CheD